jgi:hypothetical protein
MCLGTSSAISDGHLFSVYAIISWSHAVIVFFKKNQRSTEELTETIINLK